MIYLPGTAQFRMTCIPSIGQIAIRSGLAANNRHDSGRIALPRYPLYSRGSSSVSTVSGFALNKGSSLALRTHFPPMELKSMGFSVFIGMG